MFDGVACSSVFGGEGTPPEINLLPERLEMLTGGSSFSLHFGPEFLCESTRSVTLTVPLEGPSYVSRSARCIPIRHLDRAEGRHFLPCQKGNRLSATSKLDQ